MDSLVAGWSHGVDGTDWVQRITDIHNQYGKPVQITEIAFFAYDGAAANSNSAAGLGPLDEAEQRDQ